MSLGANVVSHGPRYYPTLRARLIRFAPRRQGLGLGLGDGFYGPKKLVGIFCCGESVDICCITYYIYRMKGLGCLSPSGY